MAKDASQRTSRSNGGSGILPVAVAVLAVAGFLVWLATRQPPETVVVDESQDTTAVAQTDLQATVVDPATLTQSAAARGLIGQTIEVSSVRVQDSLGSQMFWIEMPDGSPYLVKVAEGAALPATGSQVRVIGQVAEKTPAVLDGWMESGALQSADQRMLAEFGATYIEAQRVQPAVAGS